MQNETDLTELRQDCRIANKFWGLAWSALHLVLLREKGPDALHRLWPLVLGAHQKMKYREGLRKLGIADSEPPAVIAAKYHYYTNLIGGLRMEYVEESPKKVWIRYTGPMWTYPGLSMLAVPTDIRRSTFAGWHPHNGRLMGCKRLGWVATKFITEGAPYDEGYFEEHDHDLAPGDELRYETIQHTPEFDPQKAPQLDPILWPEARCLKASRNWSGGYVQTTVEQLHSMYGENSACYMVSEAMRGIGIQYTSELNSLLGVSNNNLESIENMLTGLLRSCGQIFHLQRTSSKHFQIKLRTFKPFDESASDLLRSAFFAFPATAVRMMNGRVEIKRNMETIDGVPTEIWNVTNTEKWLW